MVSKLFRSLHSLNVFLWLMKLSNGLWGQRLGLDSSAAARHCHQLQVINSYFLPIARQDPSRISSCLVLPTNMTLHQVSWEGRKSPEIATLTFSQNTYWEEGYHLRRDQNKMLIFQRLDSTSRSRKPLPAARGAGRESTGRNPRGRAGLPSQGTLAPGIGLLCPPLGCGRKPEDPRKPT